VEISGAEETSELLQNPATSVLHAVSIPTQMALEETKDLVAACQRMGIAVPLVFLNLMTPPCDCACVSRPPAAGTVGGARFPAGVPGETADPWYTDSRKSPGWSS